MDTDLNHCVLTGVLERAPITRFADHGTQMTALPSHAPSQAPQGRRFASLALSRARAQGLNRPVTVAPAIAW
jgi:hypothetical protein